MFIQINSNDLHNVVFTINTDHIIYLFKSDHGNMVYLTNGRDLAFTDKDYDVFLSKLKQAYVEVI